MRIQNILDTLTNRWIIATCVVWAVLVIVGVFAFACHIGNMKLENEKTYLTNEIKTLLEKRDLFENNKVLDLEDKKLSVILKDLLSASKKSGVRLGETEVGDMNKHDDFYSLPITVSVKGTYNQIGKFVNIVEKNLQFKINEISLSTKKTKKTGIICKIKAEFITL